MKQYSILYVAPAHSTLEKLDTEREIQLIQAIPNTSMVVMDGEVKMADFAKAVTTYHDIIVIASHGGSGRIAFTDATATPLWLALQISKSKPKVVLLATCMSALRNTRTLRSIAEEISRQGVTTVATLRELGDSQAILYDVEFIRAITSGAELMQAHSIALEQISENVMPDDTIVVIPAYVAHSATLEQVMERITELSGRVEAIDRHLVSIIASIKEHGAVMERLSELRTMIDAIGDQQGAKTKMLEMLSASQDALIKIIERVGVTYGQGMGGDRR